VQKTACTSIKKPATSARGSGSKSAAAQSQSGSKDINSSLVQRALDLVHEGQLTASVAIKLFGIPRSTFYKKLSTCSQQTQPTSTPDLQTDQYYQADSDFQAGFGTEDFGGDIVNSFVGAAGNSDETMQVGQWSSFGDYYAT